MFSFLNGIDEEELIKCLRTALDKNSIEFPAELSREEICSAIFSVYGFDLLYEENIRRALLLSLDEAVLLGFAQTLRQEGLTKKYDIAARLAGLRWGTTAKLSSLLADFLSIPDEFLPKAGQGVSSTCFVEPFFPPGDLFDYQSDVAEQLKAQFVSETDWASLVQLPTGSGKTRTVIEAIVSFLTGEGRGLSSRGSVLWLAHTEELCEQAVESFSRIWQARGDQGRNIFRFWGSFKKPSESLRNSFIVGGYQKTANACERDDEVFKDLKKQVRMVVVDEGHKALAPTIREVVESFKAVPGIDVVGLSATPGRGSDSTGENRELASLFDDRLLTSDLLGEDPITFLQERGILSHFDLNRVETNFRCQLTEREIEAAARKADMASTVLEKLAANKERNQLIIEQVLEAVQEGLKVLLFACTVDHARQLAVQIALRGFKAASIDCRMRRAQRHNMVASFRRGEIDLMCNYGVLSTGFDAPNVGAVVITRPTSSVVLYSQMIGRGLRGQGVGGTAECKLIDIKDNFENFGAVGEVYNYFQDYWE